MSKPTKGHVPGMESIRAIRENQDRPAPLREADVAEMEAHAKTCACNHDYLVRLIAAYRDLQGKLDLEYNDSRGLNSLFKSAAEERDAMALRYESLSTRHWTCNKCGGQWFCDRAEVPTVSGNHTPCKMCPWCEKQFILDDAIELAGYVHDLIALAQGRPTRTVRQETMLEKASKYFDNAAIQGHHDAVMDAQRS